MRTIEQRRASDALKRIEDLKVRSDGFKKLYRAYVDRIGPTIVMNSLGQALATERAAAGSNPSNDREQAHHEVYVSLKGWLCREGGVYPAGQDLLKAITKHGESHYLHAQAEALAWLEWHKKCCRASFPKGEEGAE